MGSPDSTPHTAHTAHTSYTPHTPHPGTAHRRLTAGRGFQTGRRRGRRLNVPLERLATVRPRTSDRSTKRLEFAAIGLSHEGLERQDLHHVSMSQMLPESTARVEIAQSPTVPAQDKVGGCVLSSLHFLSETHSLERYFLPPFSARTSMTCLPPLKRVPTCCWMLYV